MYINLFSENQTLKFWKGVHYFKVTSLVYSSEKQSTFASLMMIANFFLKVQIFLSMLNFPKGGMFIKIHQSSHVGFQSPPLPAGCTFVCAPCLSL